VRPQNPKLRVLLDKPVEIWQLPPLIPRSIGAAFALLSVRTLVRNEKAGGLTPIRRGPQSVYYERGQFLKWLGIEPSEPAPASTPTPMEKPQRRGRRPLKGKALAK
jgi:hypothetical protein